MLGVPHDQDSPQLALRIIHALSGYKWLIALIAAIAISIYALPDGRHASIDGRMYYIPPEYPGGQHGIPDNTQFATAVLWPSMEPYTREKAKKLRPGTCGVIEIMVSEAKHNDSNAVDYDRLMRERAVRLHAELRQAGKFNEFEVWDMLLPNDVGNSRYYLKRDGLRAVEEIECSPSIQGKSQSCSGSYIYRINAFMGIGLNITCLSDWDAIKEKVDSLLRGFETTGR